MYKIVHIIKALLIILDIKMETKTKETLTPSDLSIFTGTEQYYRMYTVLLTDGAKYFCDIAETYWFVDIVWTEIAPWQKKEPFITVVLTVNNSSAIIKAHDGDYNYFFEKEIPFTDCPSGEWKFYLTDSVLMVPSEY
jgi:hypothetical protein